MKDKLLVTGAAGFLGQWTLRHFKKEHPEIELWATDVSADGPVSYADHYFQADLCQRDPLHEVIRSCRPEYVIHLAGLVGDAPLARHFSINVLGSENLYAALRQTNSCHQIIQASSASIYGLVQPDELPISEEQPYRPISSYALSKLTQDYLAVSMYFREQLPIVRACIFNILGPGQPDNLVPMAFVKQLAALKRASSSSLKVGNLSPLRDFVDVRDVINAFDLLLQKGVAGEIYNIASGEAISIGQLLEELISISDIKVSVDFDADRIRSCDVPSVRADFSKINKATQWMPQISWRQSLRDMWADFYGSHNPPSA